jgi:hypothetical protein
LAEAVTEQTLNARPGWQARGRGGSHHYRVRLINLYPIAVLALAVALVFYAARAPTPFGQSIRGPSQPITHDRKGTAIIAGFIVLLVVMAILLIARPAA